MGNYFRTNVPRGGQKQTDLNADTSASQLINTEQGPNSSALDPDSSRPDCKPLSPAYSITQPLLFSLLAKYDRILLAGCGEGYDYMSALPIYFALTKLGKSPFLANLSFSDLDKARRLNPKDALLKCGFRVHSGVKMDQVHYFPELFTCEWFSERGEEIEIFAFDHFPPTKDLVDCYQWICKEKGIQAILLVDGGTDSLTYGDETGMGTPVEDHTSMAAVDMVEGVDLKLLCCIGFGVDSFHGVSHGLFLENVAKAEKQGHFYGSFSVSKHTPEAQQYIQCYEYVASKMQASIVCSSIINGMVGEFGDFHSTKRTRSSTLFINHLMTIMWTFDLAGVNSNIPYIDKVKKSTGAAETEEILFSYRSKLETIREPLPLPM